MNRYFKCAVIFFFLPVAASSCFTDKKEKEDVDYKTSLIETDRAFSRLSEEKGMKHALMHYIDSKGVLLRPNTIPIAGGEAINYISQGNDTNYTMTWEPNGGSVARSGELGYTYGIYSLKPKDKDTVLYGTYVSIWKKQADGKWKFVLETGNEGIE